MLTLGLSPTGRSRSGTGIPLDTAARTSVGDIGGKWTWGGLLYRKEVRVVGLSIQQVQGSNGRFAFDHRGALRPFARTKSYSGNFNCSGTALSPLGFVVVWRDSIKNANQLQETKRKKEKEGKLARTGHVRVMTVRVTLTRSEQVTGASG